MDPAESKLQVRLIYSGQHGLIDVYHVGETGKVTVAAVIGVGFG
jgi:hypothetical protein